MANINKLFNKFENLTIDDMAITYEFRQNILSRIEREIAGGAMGKIYSITNQPNIVLKISNPCVNTQNVIPVVKSLCESFTGDVQIYKVVNGDKIMFILPNELSEGLIGGIFGTLTSYTKNFGISRGIYFSRAERKSYNLMDPLSPIDMINMDNPQLTAINILFQVAHGISVAQKAYRFTHYDMHTQNILFSPNNDGDYIGYPISDNNQTRFLYVNNLGFNTNIIDYGLSRIEYKNVVIMPLVDHEPIRTGSVFNPFYDFAAFMGSILYFHNEQANSRGHVHPLAQFLYESLGRKFLADLLVFMYNYTHDVPEAPDVIIHNIQRLNYSGWRPKRGSNKFVLYRPTKYIDEILKYLSIILIHLHGGTYNPPLDRRFFVYQAITTPAPRVPRRITNHSERPTQQIHVAPGLYYEQRKFSRFSNEWYGLYGKPLETHTVAVKRPCNETNQIYHLMYVNLVTLISRGYQLKNVCCKIGPITYLENHSGFAVNGGFFDLKYSYRGIGPFREFNNQFQYESNIPIPAIYREDYKIITTDNQELVIHDLNPQTLSQASNYFMAGPVLVQDSNVIFNRKKYKDVTLVNGYPVYKYQCRKPANPGENTMNIFPNSTIYRRLPANQCQLEETRLENIGIFNCNTIKPGELSHASNPNPRTMMIIRDAVDDRGEVIFVVIEGRGDRGDGVDLAFMAELAKTELGAKYAINLDGGGSSNMAWRMDGGDIVTINPKKTYSYPVGNIIALVKDV